MLEGYLPQQLSEDETRTLVRPRSPSWDLSSKKDIGALMKAVMAQHKGSRRRQDWSQRVAGELLA